MISANDVDLIIFDMDGTIVSSVEPVYEAIKRAFFKLGWPVDFQEEAIRPYFGTAGGGVYTLITPAEGGLSPAEVRDKVSDEYADTFREFARPFPGVKETLTVLKQRGYRLALYSNSSVRYFDTVTAALGVRGYFDYLECIGENGLTKPELVAKIRDVFHGRTAAVVGDRHHDIEAARTTDSLAVGVLFGYGEKEPEQADVTIGEFADLLTVFDRRLPIFEKIRVAIERKKSTARPCVVGITGIDGSGKTRFTASLAAFLASKKLDVQVVNLDDFHNPRAVRYSGEDQADNYYRKSFDIGSILNNILIPVREKGEHFVELALLDLPTDRYEIRRRYSFKKETVVLFEGVFLFRDELSPYIDYKVFLDIPFAVSRQRAAARDVPVYGEEVLEKYDGKYLPAQQKYLEEYPPEAKADLIIDNRNWEYPVIREIL